MPIHRPSWKWGHVERLAKDRKEALHATSHSINHILTRIELHTHCQSTSQNIAAMGQASNHRQIPEAD
eukprot:10680174-Karenia_brevis.AAC.1